MREIFVFGSNLAGRHGRGAALAAVQALALRAMADRLEHDEAVPEELLNVSFIAA